jgi:hypothetical protein
MQTEATAETPLLLLVLDEDPFSHDALGQMATVQARKDDVSFRAVDLAGDPP